jgi:hypothetical protein
MTLKEEAMKAALKWLLLGLLLAAFVTVSSPVATAQAPVTLQVYDPTGAFEVTQLFTARLADLNGKTICEVTDDMWEADRTFPVIRDLLQKQFPTAKIVPFSDLPGTGDEKVGEAAKAKGCQAVIVGNAG